MEKMAGSIQTGPDEIEVFFEFFDAQARYRHRLSGSFVEMEKIVSNLASIRKRKGPTLQGMTYLLKYPRISDRSPANHNSAHAGFLEDLAGLGW